MRSCTIFGRFLLLCVTLLLLEACTNPISPDSPSSEEEFDRDPPQQLTIYGASATNDPILSWSWESGQGGVGYYRYRLDGAPWSYTEETSYTHPVELPEGTYSFDVAERDSSGNWSFTVTFATEVDLTPPDPPPLTAVGSELLDTNGDPVPGYIVSSDTRPRWEWGPSGTGISLYRLDTSQVDGAGPTGESGQTSYRPIAQLPSGSYTLRVSERDAAHNWSDWAELSVLIDLSVPEIELLDDTGITGDALTATDPPRWRITSGTGPSETDGYRWRVDGLPWTELSGNSPLTLLPPAPWGDGIHTIELQQRRTDSTYSASAAATVRIDATPPPAPQILGISSGVFQPDQSFTLSGESGTEVEYSLDGGLSWHPYTGEVLLDRNGVYEVTARQRDAAGNLSELAPALTVTIDKTPPLILTAPVTGVSFHEALSGGEVTGSGGEPVSDRGVCWNTTGAPTILDSCASAGSGVGTFATVITGLDAATTYTIRAYATNSIGTAYGAQLAFTTPSITIGDTYKGGIVFHLNGPAGGLIAAPSDQSAGRAWSLIETTTGASAPTIGAGAANTATISAAVGVDSAAGLCEELSLNGYDDWFLPSEQELFLIYQNLKLPGHGSLANALYWSSTEADAEDAQAIDFSDGSITSTEKGGALRVRAVRAF